MKKIFTVIMLVFACLVATAQEVHGYYEPITNDLSSKGFLVEESGYEEEKSGDDYTASEYLVILTTPKHYDEEQTRLAIVKIMNQYKDVSVFMPWYTKSFSDCDGSVGTYEVENHYDDASVLRFYIMADKEDRCTVFLYEICKRRK